MKLRDKLNLAYNRFIAAQFMKRNPVGRLWVQATALDGNQPRQFDERHELLYRANVYVYACIRAIASAVSATPLVLQKRIMRDGNREWDTVEGDTDVSKILATPNPNEDWAMLSERWISSALADGNGYMVFDRRDVELYHCPSSKVELKADALGKIVQYTFKEAGDRIAYSSDDVIHLRMVNPLGEYQGMPPSETIKRILQADDSMDRHVNSYFNNGTILGLTLTTTQSLTETQISQIRQQIELLHKGPDKSFRTAVFGNGATPNVLNQTMKDALPQELDLRLQRRILAAYRVPPIVIGLLDGASYANAFQQYQSFQRDAVEPQRRSVEAVLNMQLLPRIMGSGYDPNSLRLVYDRSQIDGMQEDRTIVSTRIQGEYRTGIVTLNEAREKLGYDVIDDERGDEFYSPFSGIDGEEASGNIGEPLDEDEDTDNEDRSEKRFPSRRKLIASSTATVESSNDPLFIKWKAHDSRASAHEPTLKKFIRSYWDEQANRLIERIEKIGGRQGSMTRVGLKLMMKSVNPNDPNLFDFALEEKELRRLARPVVKKVLEDSGDAAVRRTGLSISFDVTNPYVQTQTVKFVNQIVGINNRTYKEIQQAVVESYNAGASLQDLVKDIESIYSRFNRTRAVVIARTESNGLENAGTLEAWRQGGIKSKTWLATRDDRVRDAHAEADGQTVGIDDKFMVDGELLDHPTDPDGSAGNVIQCRCTMLESM